MRTTAFEEAFKKFIFLVKKNYFQYLLKRTSLYAFYYLKENGIQEVHVSTPLRTLWNRLKISKVSLLGPHRK